MDDGRAHTTVRTPGARASRRGADAHTHQLEVGMTRTDVMASSRPLTPRSAAGARRSRSFMRALLVLPVLLLAFALLTPGAAVAAGESTSGYSSKPEEPKTGTSPEKESTPKKEEAPAKETTTAPTAEKASTLPFTGFDLRWSLVVGVVLMGAGFSIVVVQRRQHRSQR